MHLNVAAEPWYGSESAMALATQLPGVNRRAGRWVFQHLDILVIRELSG